MTFNFKNKFEAPSTLNEKDGEKTYQSVWVDIYSSYDAAYPPTKITNSPTEGSLFLDGG